MWFLLRAGIVIGTLAWLSIVRESGPPTPPDWLAAAPKAALTPENADKLWRSLPPQAQQAILERVDGEALLRHALTTPALPPDRRPADTARR